MPPQSNGSLPEIPHLNQMLPDKEYLGMDVAGMTGNCSEKCCQWNLQSAAFLMELDFLICFIRRV